MFRRMRCHLRIISDALNITRDAEGIGQDNVVSNINGNQRVLYTLPAGTNKRIGNHA
jgi:hypothetical protein